MSNADFAKPETKLGPEAIAGDVIYLMVTHAHEHLGQSIAYAGMMNGVMPPWTAEAGKNPETAGIATPEKQGSLQGFAQHSQGCGKR